MIPSKSSTTILDRYSSSLGVLRLERYPMVSGGNRHEFPTRSEIWPNHMRAMIRGYDGTPCRSSGQLQSCRKVGRRGLLHYELEDNKWPIRIVEITTSHLTAMFMRDRTTFPGTRRYSIVWHFGSSGPGTYVKDGRTYGVYWAPTTSVQLLRNYMYCSVLRQNDLRSCTSQASSY